MRDSQEQADFFDSNNSQMFSLRDFLLVLFGIKWRALAILLVALLFGVLAAFASRPSYSSNILLRVDSNSQNFSALSGVGQLINQLPKLSRFGSQAETEQQLLSSRYVLASVIKKLNLDIQVSAVRFPILGKIFVHSGCGAPLAKPWFGLSHYAWGGECLRVTKMHVPLSEYGKAFILHVLPHQHYVLYASTGQLALKGVVGKLAQSSPKNPTFSLLVSSLHARVGQRFVVVQRSIPAVINSELAALNVSQYGGNTNILKVTFRSHSANQVISVLNTIGRTAEKLGEQTQKKHAQQTLAFLHKQLPIAEKELSGYEDRLAKYQSGSGSVDETVQYRLLLQRIILQQQQLQTLQLKRTKLLQQFTEQHPFVITVEQKIKAVKQAIAKLRTQMRHLPKASLVSQELLRNIKTHAQLYSVLISQEQETRMMEAGNVSDVQVLSYAVTPPLMKQVPKPLIVIIALLLGCLVDAGLAYLRLQKLAHCLTPEILEEKYALSTLAIIPYSTAQKRLIVAMEQNSSSYNDFILARQFPEDLSVDALQSLRTGVSLLLEKRSGVVLTINGLASAVGKSFVSANLALLFANIGKKVLLIDADLRRGHLNRCLKLQAIPGVAELLEGKVELSECMQNIQENFDFVAAGTLQHESTDLLSGQRLETMIATAKQHYDLVLVDNAPQLLVSDSLLVARHADFNIMLISTEASQAVALHSCLQKFEQENITCHGVVFNFSRRCESNIYRYRSGYGRAYSYKSYR